MKLANRPAGAQVPRCRAHSSGGPASEAPWRRGASEATRGLPESHAAAGSRWRAAGRTREPANPLGRGGGEGERPRTQTARPKHPRAGGRNCPNYRGATAQAPRSHFLCRPEGREERKKLPLPRSGGTCAEAPLTPRRSHSASNLRIGRKLVGCACMLPSDRFDKFAAPLMADR